MTDKQDLPPLPDEAIDAIAKAQDDEGWFTSRLTAIEWRSFARDVIRSHEAERGSIALTARVLLDRRKGFEVLSDAFMRETWADDAAALLGKIAAAPTPEPIPVANTRPLKEVAAELREKMEASNPVQARYIDLFAEASKWSKQTGNVLDKTTADLLGWLTGYLNGQADAPNHVEHHLDMVVSNPVQAEAPTEMSPEFTDTARAALLWVLWHHQGGSSKVGQPIRFALGMGQHDHLNDHQVSEAKRWGELAATPPTASPVGERAYSIDSDQDGIRERVCNAIDGAMAFGFQGVNPPPEGHWLERYWGIGREGTALATQPQGHTDVEMLANFTKGYQLGLAQVDRPQEVQKPVAWHVDHQGSCQIYTALEGLDLDGCTVTPLYLGAQSEQVARVAIVEEQLDDNCARVRWIFNPVPEGQELLWDHQGLLAARTRGEGA